MPASARPHAKREPAIPPWSGLCEWREGAGDEAGDWESAGDWDGREIPQREGRREPERSVAVFTDKKDAVSGTRHRSFLFEHGLAYIILPPPPPWPSPLSPHLPLRLWWRARTPTPVLAVAPVADHPRRHRTNGATRRRRRGTHRAPSSLVVCGNRAAGELRARDVASPGAARGRATPLSLRCGCPSRPASRVKHERNHRQRQQRRERHPATPAGTFRRGNIPQARRPLPCQLDRWRQPRRCATQPNQQVCLSFATLFSISATPTTLPRFFIVAVVAVDDDDDDNSSGAPVWKPTWNKMGYNPPQPNGGQPAKPESVPEGDATSATGAPAAPVAPSGGSPQNMFQDYRMSPSEPKPSLVSLLSPSMFSSQSLCLPLFMSCFYPSADQTKD